MLFYIVMSTLTDGQLQKAVKTDRFLETHTPGLLLNFLMNSSAICLSESVISDAFILEYYFLRRNAV
jgi:hypothetical protein